MNQFRVPFLNQARYQKLIDDATARHAMRPNTTPDQYLAQLHSELQQQIKGKRLIYLDTNHWVKLRKARNGDRDVPETYHLINKRIVELREKNLIICPLNATLVEELMSQSDPATRSSTAKLMDELSGGLCLRSWLELARMEWHRHVHRTLHFTEEPEYSNLTRFAYWAGVQFPFPIHLGDFTARTLAKVHIDIYWAMTCEEFQSWPGWKPPPKEGMQEMLAIASKEKQMLLANKATVDEARRATLGAWFRALEPELIEFVPRWSRGVPGTHDDHMRRIVQGLVDDLHAMPSLHVFAGLDAAITLSNRQLNLNDTRDFMHAGVAVPYCDAFFNDKHMETLMRAKPRYFDKTCCTTILSRPDEIAEFFASFS